MLSPLKTFIIYARDDKEHKNLLLRHLRPLVASQFLEVWHDGDILPGEDWEKEIKKNLKSSDLVLVLVSVNCLNSEFIQTSELTTALERFREGLAKIIPIIVSPCVWKRHPIFQGLQGLPEDMKPIISWPHQDEAWTSVVNRLAEMVEEIQSASKEMEKKKQEDMQRQFAEKREKEKLEFEQQRENEQTKQQELNTLFSMLINLLKSKKFTGEYGTDVIERQIKGMHVEISDTIKVIRSKSVIDNEIIERGFGAILTDLQYLTKALKNSSP